MLDVRACRQDVGHASTALVQLFLLFIPFVEGVYEREVKDLDGRQLALLRAW